MLIAVGVVASVFSLVIVIVVIGAVVGTNRVGSRARGLTGPTFVPDDPFTTPPSPPTSRAPTTPPTTPLLPGYRDGTLAVGTDIPPGRYRGNLTGGSCYWERRTNFGEDIESVLANDINDGPALVEIAPTDVAFRSVRCGAWDVIGAPVTPDGVPLGDGTFLVGLDVTPGTYRSEGNDHCYWERISSLRGGMGSIIDNENVTGTATVTIGPRDLAFQSGSCEPWTRVR